MMRDSFKGYYIIYKQEVRVINIRNKITEE